MSWVRPDSLRRAAPLIVVLVLLALQGLFSTAGPPAASLLVARRVDSAADVPGGKGALGRVGDYLLANDRIVIIIDDVGKRQGFAEGGGNVVDAARRTQNVDHLSQLITYFDNSFPRQAVYDHIAIVDDGSGSQEARIRVSGVEFKDRRITVATEYSLRPGQNYLKVETTLVNTGPSTLADFELGDAIQWGYAEPFAPGVGNELRGRNLLDIGWVAGSSDSVSYGYTVRSGRLAGPNGSNWSDMIVRTVNLEPHTPASYTRYLIVGTGDLASVTDEVFSLRDEPSGQVSGHVVEETTGLPIGDARIRVQTGDGKPFNLIHPLTDGSFTAHLPPGNYRLLGSALGRATPQVKAIRVTAPGETDVRLLLGRQGRFRFAVSDADTGRRIPAKITFQGLGQTPEPMLGPAYDAKGALNVVFSHTGKGETLIPPGLYQVTVSRGIEFTIESRRVAVEPGATASIEAVLKRVLDTRGYLSGDFHLHSEYSADSNITLSDKVISLAAEGVELAVSSDHNHLADYTSAIRELDLGRELKSIVGDEVTLSGTIHFNVFPLELRPGLPRNGAIDPAAMKVQEMIDTARKDPGDEIVQLNHPRAGNIGYFTTSRFDARTLSSPNPEFTLDFDAIEVFNGKRVPEAEEVMQDWFQLLNAGYRITATGNSDSHTLVSEESGYPRNFLLLGKDDPLQVTEEEVVSAVKAHRLIVTNGPFPTLLVNGRYGPGDQVRSEGRPVAFSVRLQSAPWVDISEVTLVSNGSVLERRLIPHVDGVDKGIVTFAVSPVRDAWYVVVVRGNKSLAPVIPNLGDREVMPFAFTNPVWVDADNDGGFSPVRKEPR